MHIGEGPPPFEKGKCCTHLQKRRTSGNCSLFSLTFVPGKNPGVSPVGTPFWACVVEGSDLEQVAWIDQACGSCLIHLIIFWDKMTMGEQWVLLTFTLTMFSHCML